MKQPNASTRTYRHAGDWKGDNRISLLIYHRDGTLAIPIVDGQPLVLGRGPADVVVGDDGVSRQHARFEIIRGQVWVTDLKSTNGTLVNGQPVERHQLRLDDEVRVGATLVTLHRVGRTRGAVRGLDGHDGFMSLLGYECDQVRVFHRKLALLLVQGKNLQRLTQQIRQFLRPVDRIGLYSPDIIEIMVPGAGQGDADVLARGIVHHGDADAADIRCGVALCPLSAGSAEELISVALSRLRAASAAAPICSGASSRSPAVREDVPSEAPVLVSREIREVFHLASRLAVREVPVLILGETGTGKEVVARTMHELGRRRERPLVSLNCAAIPASLVESTLFGHVRGAFTGADRNHAGLFEKANRGTLLLDEIGELSLPAQASLLRVLEQRCITPVGSTREIPVDVRLFAATHRDLEALCEQGAFREDLLYRINGVSLEVPPLRERSDDIIPLAEAFVARASRENHLEVKELSPEAAEILVRHSWPGNVRELRNVVERAVVLCRAERITPSDLSEKLRSLRRTTPGEVPVDVDHLKQLGDGLDFRERIQRVETELILEGLRIAEWNQSAAARALRIPMRTLTRKMAAYGIRRLGYGLAKE